MDGLERELKGRAQVVRLDVVSEIGRQAAYDYEVRSLPTFLIFDGQGQIVYRQAGLISREQVREVIVMLESKEAE